MKDPRDIIKRPIITENTMNLTAQKKYTFEVDVKANKTEVKEAVEKIFGVKVEKVNIMNYKGKFKRVGRYSGYTNRRRKAICSKYSLKAKEGNKHGD
jgi:large subunit ribosomal protein L23